MKSSAVESILFAIVSLGLAAASVFFGTVLLPPRMDAEAAGTVVPWFVTWGMIGLTVLSAILVAGFLLVTGLSERRR